MNELSLLELFAQATLIVKIVVVILIIASIITWLIIVERYLHFQEAENFNNEFETLFWNTEDVDNYLRTPVQKINLR
jgi:biopolymer transport protein TolQ